MREGLPFFPGAQMQITIPEKLRDDAPGADARARVRVGGRSS
jgi:hypothetical protein